MCACPASDARVCWVCGVDHLWLQLVSFRTLPYRDRMQSCPMMFVLCLYSVILSVAKDLFVIQVISSHNPCHFEPRLRCSLCVRNLDTGLDEMIAEILSRSNSPRLTPAELAL